MTPGIDRTRLVALANSPLALPHYTFLAEVQG